MSVGKKIKMALGDIANSQVLHEVQTVLNKVDNISTSLKRVEIASYVIAVTFVLVAIVALILYIIRGKRRV